MTELVSFLFGFYVVFNLPVLWEKFVRAKDEERVAFGILVFDIGLLYFWFSLVR